jgi:putative PIN family toxin of toxin-antitoxin system
LKRKLRAVIDTNLFVSGLFAKDTVSAQLQDLWVEQRFELVTSLEIIKEVSRVLGYPRIKASFNPKEENVRRFFRLLFRKAIISRDPHLRNLKHYHGIQIIDATTFIAKVGRGGRLSQKADPIKPVPIVGASEDGTRSRQVDIIWLCLVERG